MDNRSLFNPPPQAPEPRSAKLLKEFTAYCEQNPDFRFWQALRNWAEVSFLVTSDVPTAFTEAVDRVTDRKVNLKDTFNWEGRNG